MRAAVAMLAASPWRGVSCATRPACHPDSAMTDQELPVPFPVPDGTCR
ncbi:MAG: hypothetical protein OEL88_01385 [Sterolibacteriaceae bacterium MAG5]|nr:hypothetical protein [Candidatus Nitricoxidireducens bremensis]